MSEQWVPKSKDELLSAVEREWDLLLAVAERLSPEQMAARDEGGWSPKDNLAHLGEWMNLLMDHHIDKRPAHEVLGVSPEVADGWDMEIINPVLFERNRNRPADEVLAWLKQIYEKLSARLKSMSWADMLRPRHAEDPEKRPLLMWILGDTTEHFEEHRQTIEKML